MTTGHILYPWKNLGHCTYVTDGHKSMEGCSIVPGAWYLETRQNNYAVALESPGFLVIAQPGNKLPFTVLHDEVLYTMDSLVFVVYGDARAVLRLGNWKTK